jgi:hypothetical protein
VIKAIDAVAATLAVEGDAESSTADLELGLDPISGSCYTLTDGSGRAVTRNPVCDSAVVVL